MAEGEHQQPSLPVVPHLQTKATRYGQKRIARRDLFQSHSSFIYSCLQIYPLPPQNEPLIDTSVDTSPWLLLPPD